MPVELIDNFEHDYTFVGNDGPTLYFKTDLDAPRRRLIAIDLDRPAAKNWQEIIPQAEATLVEMSFVGNRFIASYLKDVRAAGEGVFPRGPISPRRRVAGHRRRDRLRREADRQRDFLHVFQLRHAAQPLPLRRRQRRKQPLSPRRR